MALYATENRITQEWREEYLHIVLHIFARCQESLEGWSNFLADETYSNLDFSNDSEIEKGNRIGVLIFSRMLIATSEYFHDERSPIFELM